MTVRSIASFLLILLVPLLVGSATQAQNLLVNPDFDSDASGWTADVAWIVGSFDAEDMDEPSPSGSVLVENSRAFGGGSGLFQCVAVSGGTLYDFSIWTRIPLGQALSGDASLRLFRSFHTSLVSPERTLTTMIACSAPPGSIPWSSPGRSGAGSSSACSAGGSSEVSAAAAACWPRPRPPRRPPRWPPRRPRWPPQLLR